MWIITILSGSICGHRDSWNARASLRIFRLCGYFKNNGPEWRCGCGFCGDFETRWSRRVITGLVRRARSFRCHCDSYLISVIAARAACMYGALETTLIFMHTRVEDTVGRCHSKYFRIMFEEDSSRAHLNFLSGNCVSDKLYWNITLKLVVQ